MTAGQSESTVRAQWSSESAFIFSMAAATVGLGNLWRFPYMVGENGGAAFTLAYLIALAVVALPIMMLEVGVGRLAKGSVVATFRKVHRLATPLGWLIFLLTVLIMSYYLVLTGWTMGYGINAIRGNLEIFEVFTVGYNSLWFFLGVTALTCAVLLRGVTGIEKLSKLLMPVLLLMIISLVVVATRVDGWSQARDFLLQADFSRLSEPSLWVFAFGQAFYSLGIGGGYLITYGSYIPRKTHVPRATLIIAGTETMVALLAGWMIFPFVFTYGFDPAAGSQLAFNILPLVFTDMPGGGILAIAFFALFFMAAFTSCLGGVKVITAVVHEEFKMSYTKAIVLVGIVLVALGIPSALSFTPVSLTLAGIPVLDFVDKFGGTNVIIASGIIGAGVFCWFVPRREILRSLGTWNRWWEWRIVLVGRSLPFLVPLVLILLWLMP